MSPLLPADWRAVTVEADPEPIHRKHPLASRGGMALFAQIVTTTEMWRALSRPQRELLLSTVAGFPVVARADVKARLVARGLIGADGSATDAGRLVVQWRTP